MFDLDGEHGLNISIEKPETHNPDSEGLNWKILIGFPAEHVEKTVTDHLLYLDPAGVYRELDAYSYQVTPALACEGGAFIEWADLVAALVKGSLEKPWIGGLDNHNLVHVCTSNESRKLVAETLEWNGCPAVISPQACTYKHLYVCLGVDTGYMLHEYLVAGEQLSAANPEIETLLLGTTVDERLLHAVLLLGVPA